MSKNDISQVSGVVREVRNLGERAKQTAEKMRLTVSQADASLGKVDALADELADVTRELDEVLGFTGSNFPPADDTVEDKPASALGVPTELPEWVKKPE